MLNRNELLKEFNQVGHPQPVKIENADHLQQGPNILQLPKTLQTLCRCWHCDQNKWPLLYKLSEHEDNYWFEIPRSGSVTIKELFNGKHGRGDRGHAIQRSDPRYPEIVRTAKPIVIFTDPIERFLSTVNAYLVETERYWSYGNHAFLHHLNGTNLATFDYETRWHLFFENMDVIRDIHQVHHFHDQCSFVDTKNFQEFQFVWKKDIGKFFQTEEVMNKTNYKITREMITPHQEEWLKNYYKKDYIFIDKHS